MMYIFNKIDGIEIAAIDNIDSDRDSPSISLSIFIVKELPGVGIIRKEPNVGYASTPVSNSSGYRICAGAKVKKEETYQVGPTKYTLALLSRVIRDGNVKP